MKFTVIDPQTGKEPDMEKICMAESWINCLAIYRPYKMEFALTDEGNLVVLDAVGQYTYCPPDRFSVIVSTESLASKPQDVRQ